MIFDRLIWAMLIRAILIRTLRGFRSGEAARMQLFEDRCTILDVLGTPRLIKKFL